MAVSEGPAGPHRLALVIGNGEARTRQKPCVSIGAGAARIVGAAVIRSVEREANALAYQSSNAAAEVIAAVVGRVAPFAAVPQPDRALITPRGEWLPQSSHRRL